VQGRAYPLNEPNMPRRGPGGVGDERVTTLHAILDFLDVERSARYRPSPARTYCNVYAHDYCHLAGVYLPRVWWTADALPDLIEGRTRVVHYGQTVTELNANALYDWLGEWGPAFGWAGVSELTGLQDAANEGEVAVVCAKARPPGRSGHITCVIPERATETASRRGTVVVAALQSQAGRHNYRRFTDAWWETRAGDFEAVGFWRCDPTGVSVT
jgi:hypothetical protein